MFKGNLVVVGCQWGDEGKGKIIDMLAKNADAVVRYQGGHNAGHTIYHNNNKLVLHLIPSGILNPRCTCFIGQGVVVCPKAISEEINTLNKYGFNLQEKLKISPNCTLILPSHKALDISRENKSSKPIGTTGRGIGPAYEDKVARRSIKIADIFEPDILKDKLIHLLDYHNFLLSNLYKQATIDFSMLFNNLLEFSEKIKNYVTEINHNINLMNSKNKNIIFEGAQGTLLDIDHGTYPYVTSSNTTASAAGTSTGFGPNFFNNVLGIFKAYCTRVGEGPFPTEIKDSTGEYIQQQGGEFGSTTGRTRRCGWLDLVALKHAIRLNGITKLCITKLDVLKGIDEIKVCTKYHNTITKQSTSYYPETNNSLKNCVAQYETFAGWSEDISKIRDLNYLPNNAKNYLKFIEDYLQAKIEIISVGQNREDSIIV